MRKDGYAEYACGHIEEDDTSMNVGQTSYCSACKTQRTIVARLIKSGEPPTTDHQIRVRELVNQALHAANEMMQRVNDLQAEGKLSEVERLGMVVKFGDVLRPLEAIRVEEPLDTEVHRIRIPLGLGVSSALDRRV